MCINDPSFGHLWELLCKTVGKVHSVREIQVKKLRKQLCTVCTQFIQGNVPITPIDCVPGMKEDRDLRRSSQVSHRLSPAVVTR